MKQLALTLAIAAIPAVSTAATRVSSDSACPSADAISQRLLGLLAAGGPAAASARVHSEEASLRIELATPGEPNRERIVPATGDCEARAEMAALIIASWLDAMPVGAVGTAPVPVREVQAAHPRSYEVEPTGAPAGRLAPGRGHTLVGAGLFGLADKQGASAGFALDAAMPNLLGHFGCAAGVSLGLPRQLSVGQGIAHYWRPTFALAATGELHASNWLVRPRIGVALGVLSVNGSNYLPNRSATTVTWGAGAGLTVARPWQLGEAWLRIEALMWPQGRSLRSNRPPSGPDLEVALPDWEMRLTAGFSWGVH
jgi:hypothetical protein